MIKLSLDCHDFAAAVEGFARGSHLRQHVWERIVYLNIPQMSDDEMDYFWFVFHRNLWGCYFSEDNGCINHKCGHEDYLHALAALHRGNRYKVTFHPESLKQPITVVCYRFGGVYRPLRTPGQEKHMASFNTFIPDEWIEDVVALPMPANRWVDESNRKWWDDLSVYDDITLTNI